MSNNPLTRLLQTCAVLTLLMALVTEILLFREGALPSAGVVTRGMVACVVALAGFGVAGILVGLSALLNRNQPADPAMGKGLSEIHAALAQLNAHLAERGHDTTIPPSSAVTGIIEPAGDLGKVVQLLDEIRDISLMDAEQRQRWLQRLLTMRRQTAAATIDIMTQESRWADARATLDHAIAYYGDGAELQAAHKRLMDAGDAAEQQAMHGLKRRVSELTAADNWDQAVTESEALLRLFPVSVAMQEYHAKLTADRTTAINSLANRLYDEIRGDIEQRSWRRALGAARRLLAKCPTHLRARQVETQMLLIRDNADVEQRNSMETRIHELVKSGRLKEAMALAKDLIDGYPNSPQAQIAQPLVERLQSRIEEIEQAGLSTASPAAPAMVAPAEVKSAGA